MNVADFRGVRTSFCLKGGGRNLPTTPILLINLSPFHPKINSILLTRFAKTGRVPMSYISK